MTTDETTIRLLEQLIAAQPDNWEARAHVAELYLGRGQAQQATAALTPGGAAPGDERIQLLLGRARAQLDPRRGIEHFRGMVGRDKRCARAYLELARLHLALGERDEAKRTYGIATVLDESLEDPALAAALASDSRPSAAPATRREPSAGDIGEDADDVEALLRDVPPSQRRLTFADVGGMADVKERIRMAMVHPFKNPELFQRFKKASGGGILLYGPPGCGKTFLARATAGECEAYFLSIGITDVLAKWVGESEQRLHDLFERARRLAPAVIFIDELDALGMRRDEAGGSGIRTVINQLLTELDGVSTQHERLMVLAATNAPWQVDTAFRRPGRFDRVIFVGPPDDDARRAIFELHLKGLPVGPVDHHRLAQATKLFSGADIHAAVERAAEQAIAEEMKSGDATVITTKMLLAAVKDMRPSTLEWFETAKNYASYANRAGQYDDLVRFFEREGL